MGRYLRGAVDAKLDIGTLAAKTLVSVAIPGVVQERTLISSVVAAYGISDWTLAVGDGPLMVGVSHGDYSDAEIESYLEATGNWDEGNKVAQESARRKIRRVGMITAPPDANVGSQNVLNDGKPIKTKLNWILNQGIGIRLWAYNMGDSAFASTDPDLFANGHANLWPR